ncbi:hypothetical protein QA597_09365 [Marinilabiliaceae bacterium ANBcel2]|nr:hypothetical protein [Marinilabiliaceae bacterium ANBcel2]
MKNSFLTNYIMHADTKWLLLVVVLILFSADIKSQRYSIHNNSNFDPFSRELYKPGANIHTSIRPLRIDEIEEFVNTDSLERRQIAIGNEDLNILQRFGTNNLFHWQQEENNQRVSVRVNPLFNFSGGIETENETTTWVNTRGAMIEGELGDNLAFYADLYENQALFPKYINEFTRERGIAPGQGRVKEFGDDAWDFMQSTGYLSYNAGQWINLQLGYGKNFIGDGYRSLLLSDNTYSYPYFKMTASFLKAKYMVMAAQMRHLGDDPVIRGGDDRFEYKYGIFHYLSWNISNRVNIGLFESVIWAAEDDTGYRGMDFSYMIPVVMYRPIEYDMGSPDNVTMGANLKVIMWPGSIFYGQFVLGEFKFDEVFSGDKWWANKHGFQTGIKISDFLGVNNLDFQTEYNQVRPFTYSHYFPITNYGHYNQELAHPLGASFRESISFLRYRTGRWHFNLEAMYAIDGKDFDDDVSHGGDIFMPSVNRDKTYGHEIGQGLRTTITHAAASISWLLNPRTNMNISAGMRLRSISNEINNSNSNHFYISFSTSLQNIYYNF